MGTLRVTVPLTTSFGTVGQWDTVTGQWWADQLDPQVVGEVPDTRGYLTSAWVVSSALDPPLHSCIFSPSAESVLCHDEPAVFVGVPPKTVPAAAIFVDSAAQRSPLALFGGLVWFSPAVRAAWWHCNPAAVCRRYLVAQSYVVELVRCSSPSVT